MQELLEKIYNNRDNGLYFINTPTGSAKSYSAVQLMKSHCMDMPNHFIFITNNLNNLPIEDLKIAFGDDYEKYVIRVESIVDNIIHNFDESIIPDEFKNLGSYGNLLDCIKNYKFQEEAVQSEIKVGHTPLINAIKYYEQSRDDLMNADINFRFEVRKKLMSSGLGDMKEEEKRSLIKTKYQWLSQLYPAIFIEDYKIICMSVKKFFTTNDPIYKKRYSFSNSEIVDNSIVFIDEVDATKNEINNIILDNCLKSTVDLIPMINRIVDKFIYWDMNMPNSLKGLVPFDDKSFNKVKKEAEFIRKNYHDELPYFCPEIKSRNFLMSDSSFHANFEDTSKKNAYIYYDTGNNQMTIEIKNSRKEITHDSSMIYSLFTVIRAMNHFLISTKAYFSNLAKKYRLIKNSKAKTEDDLINEEEAIHSIYKAFRLTDSDINYYNNEVKLQSSIHINMSDNKLKKLNNYYDRGIRSFEFTNNKHNSFNTIFNYVYVSQSAERIMVDLALKSVVIGLSATSNIGSVLSNYSLSYFEENLGEKFHRLEKDDYLRIKETYETLNRKYESNEIKVVIKEIDEIFNSDKRMTGQEMVNKSFDSRSTRKSIMRIFDTNAVIEEHYIQRYLILALVYKYFVTNEDIKSFLCLNNALPKDNSNLDMKVIKELFSVVNKELKVPKDTIAVEVLKSGISFDEDKKRILDHLSDGEKIFVISAYATIGAGQNMAYKLPDNSDTVNLTDFSNKKDGRNSKKDFDGIYLGPITHVVSNLIDTESDFKEAELLNCLIELENLYENNEITHYVLEKGIEAAYRKIKNPTIPQNISLKGCQSVMLYKSKQIIQAMGRLSRSFNKNKMIHVLVTQDIINNFDTSLLDTEILSPETVQLAKYAKRRQLSVPTFDYAENKASRISSEGKFYIYELLSGDWTEEKIAVYKELGETCLMYPTASKQDWNNNEIIKEYYIDLNDKIPKYYFTNVRDFEYTDVFFNQSKDEVAIRIRKDNLIPNWQIDNIREVSEENARLEKVLNYPGLKELFLEKGYATSFDRNDYMLSPILYQNIYKGRLGEVAGKFIIKKELGIDLEELETKEYERFDFKHNNVYIDFKHWRYSTYSSETMTKKILDKLNEVGGDKVLVINLFDDICSHKVNESERIIEIPALLDEDGFHVNQEAINKIRIALEESYGQNE